MNALSGTFGSVRDSGLRAATSLHENLPNNLFSWAPGIRRLNHDTGRVADYGFGYIFDQSYVPGSVAMMPQGFGDQLPPAQGGPVPLPPPPAVNFRQLWRTLRQQLAALALHARAIPVPALAADPATVFTISGVATSLFLWYFGTITYVEPIRLFWKNHLIDFDDFQWVQDVTKGNGTLKLALINNALDDWKDKQYWEPAPTYEFDDDPPGDGLGGANLAGLPKYEEAGTISDEDKAYIEFLEVYQYYKAKGYMKISLRKKSLTIKDKRRHFNLVPPENYPAGPWLTGDDQGTTLRSTRRKDEKTQPNEMQGPTAEHTTTSQEAKKKSKSSEKSSDGVSEKPSTSSSSLTSESDKTGPISSKQSSRSSTTRSSQRGELTGDLIIEPEKRITYTTTVAKTISRLIEGLRGGHSATETIKNATRASNATAPEISITPHPRDTEQEQFWFKKIFDSCLYWSNVIWNFVLEVTEQASSFLSAALPIWLKPWSWDIFSQILGLFSNDGRPSSSTDSTSQTKTTLVVEDTKAPVHRKESEVLTTPPEPTGIEKSTSSWSAFSFKSLWGWSDKETSPKQKVKDIEELLEERMQIEEEMSPAESSLAARLEWEKSRQETSEEVQRSIESEIKEKGPPSPLDTLKSTWRSMFSPEWWKTNTQTVRPRSITTPFTPANPGASIEAALPTITEGPAFDPAKSGLVVFGEWIMDVFSTVSEVIECVLGVVLFNSLERSSSCARYLAAISDGLSNSQLASKTSNFFGTLNDLAANLPPLPQGLNTVLIVIKDFISTAYYNFAFWERYLAFQFMKARYDIMGTFFSHYYPAAGEYLEGLSAKLGLPENHWTKHDPRIWMENAWVLAVVYAAESLLFGWLILALFFERHGPLRRVAAYAGDSMAKLPGAAAATGHFIMGFFVGVVSVIWRLVRGIFMGIWITISTIVKLFANTVYGLTMLILRTVGWIVDNIIILPIHLVFRGLYFTIAYVFTGLRGGALATRAAIADFFQSIPDNPALQFCKRCCLAVYDFVLDWLIYPLLCLGILIRIALELLWAGMIGTIRFIVWVVVGVCRLVTWTAVAIFIKLPYNVFFGVIGWLHHRWLRLPADVDTFLTWAIYNTRWYYVRRRLIMPWCRSKCREFKRTLHSCNPSWLGLWLLMTRPFVSVWQRLASIYCRTWNSITSIQPLRSFGNWVIAWAAVLWITGTAAFGFTFKFCWYTLVWLVSNTYLFCVLMFMGLHILIIMPVGNFFAGYWARFVRMVRRHYIRRGLLQPQPSDGTVAMPVPGRGVYFSCTGFLNDVGDFAFYTIVLGQTLWDILNSRRRRSQHTHEEMIESLRWIMKTLQIHGSVPAPRAGRTVSAVVRRDKDGNIPEDARRTLFHLVYGKMYNAPHQMHLFDERHTLYIMNFFQVPPQGITPNWQRHPFDLERMILGNHVDSAFKRNERERIMNHVFLQDSNHEPFSVQEGLLCTFLEEIIEKNIWGIFDLNETMDHFLRVCKSWNSRTKRLAMRVQALRIILLEDSPDSLNLHQWDPRRNPDPEHWRLGDILDWYTDALDWFIPPYSTPRRLLRKVRIALRKFFGAIGGFFRWLFSRRRARPPANGDGSNGTNGGGGGGGGGGGNGGGGGPGPGGGGGGGGDEGGGEGNNGEDNEEENDEVREGEGGEAEGETGDGDEPQLPDPRRPGQFLRQHTPGSLSSHTSAATSGSLSGHGSTRAWLQRWIRDIGDIVSSAFDLPNSRDGSVNEELTDDELAVILEHPEQISPVTPARDTAQLYHPSHYYGWQNEEGREVDFLRPHWRPSGSGGSGQSHNTENGEGSSRTRAPPHPDSDIADDEAESSVSGESGPGFAPMPNTSANTSGEGMSDSGMEWEGEPWTENPEERERRQLRRERWNLSRFDKRVRSWIGMKDDSGWETNRTDTEEERRNKARKKAKYRHKGKEHRRRREPAGGWVPSGGTTASRTTETQENERREDPVENQNNDGEDPDDNEADEQEPLEDDHNGGGDPPPPDDTRPPEERYRY